MKSRVDELEKFLEEERLKISKERAEAEASLRVAMDRIRTEAAENLKRYEEAAVRQQEQQNDIILALQVPRFTNFLARFFGNLMCHRSYS